MLQNITNIIGGIVLTATGVHALALAVGQAWHPALKVAEASGIVAVDLQQVMQWLGVKT